MKRQLNENIDVLQQGSRLLHRIDDVLYRQRSSAVLAGSIGAHVRHNLDFYASLLDGLITGSIDYDARKSDAAIETGRQAAAVEIERICRELASVSVVPACLRVHVRSDGDSADAWATTSLSRELDFLLSHTIHHHAIVAIMCRLAGVHVEDDFGVAPPTLRYWASLRLDEAQPTLPQPRRERQ
ncbi:MAG: hypothetical protein AB7N70_16510 [Dehalococcoidia bacterium]